MKRLLLLILAFVLVISTVTGCAQATEGTTDAGLVSTEAEVIPSGDYTQLFDTEAVHEVRIEIDEADWEAILDAPEDEAYHPATVTVDGVTAEEAGIRTK